MTRHDEESGQVAAMEIEFQNKRAALIARLIFQSTNAKQVRRGFPRMAHARTLQKYRARDTACESRITDETLDNFLVSFCPRNSSVCMATCTPSARLTERNAVVVVVK